MCNDMKKTHSFFIKQMNLWIYIFIIWIFRSIYIFVCWCFIPRVLLWWMGEWGCCVICKKKKREKKILIFITLLNCLRDDNFEWIHWASVWATHLNHKAKVFLGISLIWQIIIYASQDLFLFRTHHTPSFSPLAAYITSAPVRSDLLPMKCDVKETLRWYSVFHCD